LQGTQWKTIARLINDYYYEKTDKFIQKRAKKLIDSVSTYLEVDACEDDHEYKKIAISVFDHWLLKDEALTLLNDVNEEEQRRRDNLRFVFNKIIFDRTICFTYRLKGRYKNHPIFKKFTDKRAAYAYIKPNSNFVPSKYLYKLVLPQFEALYFEGWDYTSYFYFKNEKILDTLLNWAKESGLYILK
jgi:hypothetical protein